MKPWLGTLLGAGLTAGRSLLATTPQGAALVGIGSAIASAVGAPEGATRERMFGFGLRLLRVGLAIMEAFEDGELDAQERDDLARAIREVFRG